MKKLFNVFLVLVLCLSLSMFVSCGEKKKLIEVCECKCEPIPTQTQEEPKYVTILAIYKHERHDGRTDRITVLSDGSFLWAVHVKDRFGNESGHEIAFDNAEELFDHAIQYQNNWNHNNWVKVEN